MPLVLILLLLAPLTSAQEGGNAWRSQVVNGTPAAAPAPGPAPAPPAAANTPPPAAPAQPMGQPVVQPQPQQQQPQAMSMADVLKGIQNGTLPPFRKGGDDVPSNYDWSKGAYEYPDRHRFNYGSVGAGNIGSGLCTMKNANRTQVTAGYCDMLRKILETDGTCAKEALDDILRAEANGGIGDLENYCSNFKTLTTQQKRMMFQQVLAALIVQESGWRVDAQERPWTRADGVAMGGKGLFQIGVNDRNKRDCGGLNTSSILTAEPNLKCGACIALSNIAKDRTMGHGVGDQGSRGMARYFGPLRDGQSKKRVAMASAVNDWCRSSAVAGGGGAETTR